MLPFFRDTLYVDNGNDENGDGDGDEKLNRTVWCNISQSVDKAGEKGDDGDDDEIVDSLVGS